MHYTNIGRYERGDAPFQLMFLIKIATALEISPDYLMNGTIENKAKDSLKDEKMLIQFKKIEQLSEDKKSLLIEFIDGFILKNNIQQ